MTFRKIRSVCSFSAPLGSVWQYPCRTLLNPCPGLSVPGCLALTSPTPVQYHLLTDGIESPFLFVLFSVQSVSSCPVLVPHCQTHTGLKPFRNVPSHPTSDWLSPASPQQHIPRRPLLGCGPMLSVVCTATAPQVCSLGSDLPICRSVFMMGREDTTQVARAAIPDPWVPWPGSPWRRQPLATPSCLPKTILVLPLLYLSSWLNPMVPWRTGSAFLIV